MNSNLILEGVEMQITEEKLSWSEVPAEVKELLVLATDHWDDTTESEKYINAALAKAGDNYDVLIGSYRYFFYKTNPSMALQMAEKVIDKIQVEENLPGNWEELKPILLRQKEKPRIQLYLNAYAAIGYVLARLGKVEEAKEISARIKEIDQSRLSCASTVFEVLTRPPEDEDE